LQHKGEKLISNGPCLIRAILGLIGEGQTNGAVGINISVMDIGLCVDAGKLRLSFRQPIVLIQRIPKVIDARLPAWL
jgi:hypothetical protein